MNVEFNGLALARLQTLLARNVKVDFALLRSEALDMHEIWHNAHPLGGFEFKVVMDAFLKAARAEGVKL